MTNSQQTNFQSPVYILGTNAVGCYLAAKLQDAGERVVIIGSADKNNSLFSNGITVKEDFSLRKKHYTFETAAWTGEEGKALIITAAPAEIHSALIRIMPHKITAAPVICFTLLKNIGILRDILGTGIFQAVFSGWPAASDRLVSVLGEKPEIIVYSPTDASQRKNISNLFKPANLSFRFAKEEDQTFWEYFGIYAVCSLITAAHNKTLVQIIKNRQLYSLLEDLAAEISKLASGPKFSLTTDTVLNKINNIPSGYVFPLQTELHFGRRGDFEVISSVLSSAARSKGIKTPAIDSLIERICSIYLSIT